MRTSKEQTEYILAKRDEKLRAIARRRKIVIRCSISVAACFVVAIGVTFFAVLLRPANSAAPAGIEKTGYNSWYRVEDLAYSGYGSKSTTEESRVESTSFTDEATDNSDLGYNGLSDIVNENIEKSAVGELIAACYEMSNKSYSISKLRDLPEDISLYIENDDESGLLIRENNYVSYSKFNLVSSLLSYNVNDGFYSEVISKLIDCLKTASDVEKTDEQFTKQLTIKIVTENNLSLRLQILISPSGDAVIKLLPADNDAVIAYTMVSFDKEKAKALIEVME